MRGFGWLFVGALVVSTVDEAYAGKGDPAAGDEKGAKKDPYAIPEMKVTKIADFDSLFDRSKSPIESLILSRKRVDMAKARFNTSMGLAEDLSFEAGVEEFKKRMETKAKIALKKGTLPRLTTADVVPDDVQKSIDEFNTALDEIEAAYTQLGSIKSELTTLATEVTALDPAAAASSSGLNALDSATAVKNTATNAKTVTSAKEESEKLVGSIDSLTGSLEAAFGAAL